MDKRADSSMVPVPKKGDETRPYDVLLLCDNRKGTVVAMADVDNPTINLQAVNQGNVRRAMPVHYGPADRSGQAVWRPGLPAPVLCPNVTYGTSDSFAEGGRMDYGAAAPEVPRKVSYAEAVQRGKQQQTQIDRGIQNYGPAPNPGPMQSGTSAQPMRKDLQHAFPSKNWRMQGQPAPRYVPFQPNPFAGYVYNHQQGYVQHGPMTVPFQPVGPGVGAMNYQAYHQSAYFRGPVANVHQQTPLMNPTMPNLIGYPTPPLTPEDSNQIPSNTVMRESQHMGMFPRANWDPNPGFGANTMPPMYYSQFQGPAQANSQVFEQVSTVRASFNAMDPSTYGNVAQPGTMYRPNPATPAGRYPGTRRRGSRDTFKVLQNRAMCRDPTLGMGKSPSLDRSCEPVVEPPGYESVEEALAALSISFAQESAPTRQAAKTQRMYADAVQDLSNENSKKKVSWQTNNGESPNASANISSINTRSLRAYCELCKSNKETEEFYTGHVLKNRMGIVVCPVLRRLVCSICGATGDSAHTVRYCPLLKFKSDDEIEKYGDSPEEVEGAAAARVPAPASGNQTYDNNHNATGRCVPKKY